MVVGSTLRCKRMRLLATSERIRKLRKEFIFLLFSLIISLRSQAMDGASHI